MEDFEDLLDEVDPELSVEEAAAAVIVDTNIDDSEPEEPKVTRQFESVTGFVEQWFAPILTRAPGEYLWCRKWFEHAEVIARLTALWNDYEAARVAGTMSTFFIHLFDPTVAVICGQSGPFHNCKQGEHSERIIPLKCDPVPPHVFNDSDEDNPGGKPAANQPQEAA